MAINIVESKISIGPVVLLGRLGSTIHRMDGIDKYVDEGDDAEKYTVDLGIVQEGIDIETREYYGRTARANGKNVFLTPFFEHHQGVENIFGGVETISGDKINSSFLRGHLRFSKRNAEGSVILMGFKVPFIKVPRFGRQLSSQPY